MLSKLRTLNASAIVGTEVKVFTTLARQMGLGVLGQLRQGDSLGQAMLGQRLHLMRQLNPLGLAYTIYGSASKRVRGTQ